MKLRLAPDFTIPIQAVTETFGILAVRGAGKSNTAAVMAEELWKAKQPFVVVDPVRAWWGLRSSRDGTGPGLAIPIFGGRHGDVPLERGGGTLLADLVVDQRLSCVLDISDFESESAKKAFLLDFARRLYQRNEAPLHLFLEEADDYIPQKPMRDELLLLRAWENIVRRGRNRGLGCTLITQRSAVINKDVLYQVQTLIPMRTTGPGDIDTIARWVRYHHQPEDILASLPGLEDGEAWVWSPHFLKTTRRVRFRLRETYDSGATPKVSAAMQAPSTLADVDLGVIRTKMAATIERAKAEDPRELRRQVAELKAQLAKASSVKSAEPKRVEKIVRVVDSTQVTAAKRTAWEIGQNLMALQTRLRADADRVAQLTDRLSEVVELIDEARKAVGPGAPPTNTPTRVAVHVAPTARPAHLLTRQLVRAAEDVPGAGRTLPVQQRILNALAELEQLGAAEPVRELVAFLAGYSHLQSKGLVNALGALRSAGLIEYPAGGTVQLTATGRQAATPPAMPRTPDELQARVVTLLGGASERILRPLLAVYPHALPREEVAAKAGYGHLQSKGFVNAIGRLRTLGFVTYPDRGTVQAAPVLFLEGAR